MINEYLRTLCLSERTFYFGPFHKSARFYICSSQRRSSTVSASSGTCSPMSSSSVQELQFRWETCIYYGRTPKGSDWFTCFPLLHLIFFFFTSANVEKKTNLSQNRGHASRMVKVFSLVCCRTLRRPVSCCWRRELCRSLHMRCW